MPHRSPLGHARGVSSSGESHGSFCVVGRCSGNASLVLRRLNQNRGDAESGVDWFTDSVIRGRSGRSYLREAALPIYAIPDHQETDLSDDATITLPERRPSRSRALASQAIAMRRRDSRSHLQVALSRCLGIFRTVLRSAERLLHDLKLKDLHRSVKQFELMHRALGFAALAILTVVPLLIVVAATSPAPHRGLAGWVVYGMGLTGSSADAVTRLFSAPARVLGTSSAFGVLVLAVAGVSFAGSVQGGFERIWGLPAGPWHKIWRQVVWSAALIAYIYASATAGTLTHGALAGTAGRLAVAVGLGIAFFWLGLRFLVGGRVSYLAALPGAVATTVGLAGLRVFSGLVFEPLIVRNAVSYGALGTVLIVQSWLIGVGWVVYAGQLFGRWFHDGWLRAWADARSGHREPGGEGCPP